MTIYQRILLIRYGGLGDFILTLPLLAALREIASGGHVTFMGKREFASLADGIYIDTIESVEKHGISSFFIQDGELDPGLSEFFASFDLILSFRTDHEGIFAANLRRVAKGRVVVSAPSPDKSGIHASDFLLTSLDQINIDWKQFAAPFPLLPSERREKTDIIAIHPGSGSAGKCWHVDRYIEVAGRIERETKLRPVLIFGPAEEGIRHRVGWHFSAYDNREIHEVASFLTGCRVYVGNDSGITHLAAALGVPVLALFGPTDPAVWAPRGNHVRVLEGKADCAPCTEEERRQCRNKVCLDSLSTDAVFNELMKLAAES